MGKEKPQTKNTDEHNRHSEPRAIEKPVERATVGCDHAFDEIARVPFHPGAFVTGFALAQNARAHQWRQRQRDKPRRENGHDNRDGKFAENATEQPGDEDKRNENRCE